MESEIRDLGSIFVRGSFVRTIVLIHHFDVVCFEEITKEVALEVGAE